MFKFIRFYISFYCSTRTDIKKNNRPLSQYSQPQTLKSKSSKVEKDQQQQMQELLSKDEKTRAIEVFSQCDVHGENLNKEQFSHALALLGYVCPESTVTRVFAELKSGMNISTMFATVSMQYITVLCYDDPNV